MSPPPGQPVRVAPGLWMSGMAGIDATEALKITHIVSVVNGPPPPAPAAATQLHLDVADEEDANLLQHLPTALQFIASALAENQNSDGSATLPSPSAQVLVHCAQGTSRSAAVVAAHLMATRDLDPDAALDALRAAVPAAAPNPGFTAQLHLFHCMGCALDPSYVPYRRFLTQQAALKFQATGELDAAALAAPTATEAGGATIYRCRKCRTLVATSDNILETEAGGKGFSRRKRGKEAAAAARGGSGTASADAEGAGGIFVEPLQWMADAVGGEVAGKLYCPKQQCGARLGAFSWAGIQNAQGGWITPAFHLHLARLDAEDPARAAALQEQLGGGVGLAIRQPRLLGTRPTGAAQPSSAPRHFTHLVLDCDGVMVDSERPSCEALRRAILKITGFDIPHNFPIDFRPVFGMDVHSCIEYYSRRFSEDHAWPEDLETLSKAVSDAKEPIYRELTAPAGAIAAFPGTAPLVAAARAKGMGVAVASSGSPDKIAHNLETSGLTGLVPPELIVSAKHVARGKPAPDVYIEALRRLGCADASRAVVVEDAVNGLKAAAAAGCFTVAVTTSLPAEDLVEYADVVVERLEDIDFGKLEAAVAEKAAAAAASQLADGLEI